MARRTFAQWTCCGEFRLEVTRVVAATPNRPGQRRPAMRAGLDALEGHCRMVAHELLEQPGLGLLVPNHERQVEVVAAARQLADRGREVPQRTRVAHREK